VELPLAADAELGLRLVWSDYQAPETPIRAEIRLKGTGGANSLSPTGIKRHADPTASPRSSHGPSPASARPVDRDSHRAKPTGSHPGWEQHPAPTSPTASAGEIPPAGQRYSHQFPAPLQSEERKALRRKTRKI